MAVSHAFSRLMDLSTVAQSRRPASRTKISSLAGKPSGGSNAPVGPSAIRSTSSILSRRWRSRGSRALPSLCVDTETARTPRGRPPTASRAAAAHSLRSRNPGRGRPPIPHYTINRTGHSGCPYAPRKTKPVRLSSHSASSPGLRGRNVLKGLSSRDAASALRAALSVKTASQ
jgi:hypothetical protein